MSIKIQITNIMQKLKNRFFDSLHKNAYYIISSSVITAISSIIFWALATRLYNTESIGFAAALISSLGLLASISELGLVISLIRFLPNAGMQGNKMINAVLTASSLFSIILSLIFLGGIRFWAPALLPIYQNKIFLAVFVLFGVAWTLNLFSGSIFMAKRASKYMLSEAIISSVVKLAVIFPFFMLIGGSWGIVVSSGLSITIALMISFFFFIPKIQPGYFPFPVLKLDAIRFPYRYTLVNYIARIFLDAQILIVPVMVVNVLGPERTAYFYIAWSISMMLRVIPSSFANSMFAESANDGKTLRANTRRASRSLIVMLFPVIIIILVFANILMMLFGKSYSENGANLLRVLSISAIPWSVNYFAINIARVRKHLRSIMTISVLMFIFSLGLSYILMLKMGIIGIGLGYLAGQSIVAAVILLSNFGPIRPLFGAFAKLVDVSTD